MQLQYVFWYLKNSPYNYFYYKWLERFHYLLDNSRTYVKIANIRAFLVDEQWKWQTDWHGYMADDLLGIQLRRYDMAIFGFLQWTELPLVKIAHICGKGIHSKG